MCHAMDAELDHDAAIEARVAGQAVESDLVTDQDPRKRTLLCLRMRK